jgi:hypothetical protein
VLGEAVHSGDDCSLATPSVWPLLFFVLSMLISQAERWMNMMCFILLNNINQMVCQFHKLNIAINKLAIVFLIFFRLESFRWKRYFFLCKINKKVPIYQNLVCIDKINPNT